MSATDANLPSGVSTVGQMVREVTLAYDIGAEGDVERRWRSRIGRDRASVALLDGTLARLAFRYDDAWRAYTVAATDTMTPAGHHASLAMVGILANRSQFTQALTALERVTPRFARSADSTGYADALIGRAALVLRVQGVDSAKAVLQRAALAIPDRDTWMRGRLACTFMQIRVRGSENIADSAWTRVLESTRATGPRVRADCLFARAQYAESRGRANEALALLDTVADIQRDARLYNGLSATLQWRGSTLLSRGRYAEARQQLTEALDAAQTSHSVGGEAWATQEIGRIAQRVGAAGEAARYFARARALFQSSGDGTGLAFADNAIAVSALLRGELAYADSAFRVYAAQHDAVVPSNFVPGLVARANIAQRQGRVDDSRRLLDSAQLLAVARNQPGWNAQIRYHRGLEALARGTPALALAHFDTLWRSQPNLRGPSRFELLSRWAEANAANGDFEASWQSFTRAQREYDQWRTSLTRRTDALAAIQDRYFEWDRDLDFATFISRFNDGGRAPQALAMAEWRRLRGVEQQALQRGAASISADQPRVTAVRIHQSAVDTQTIDALRYPVLARTRLTPQQAVVSFVTGGGGEPTTAFVLTRDTLMWVTLTPIDSLMESIDRFGAFLQAGRLAAPLARELADALVVPILHILPERITRLIFVPDGALHRLPFATLPLDSGEPLLTRFVVALAPSVEDALGSVASVARIQTTTPRSLVIGAPATMPVAPNGATPWSDLPGARRESRAVAALLDGSVLLQGRDATQQAVLDRMALGGQVLHVATHTVSDLGSFNGSGIVLERTSSDDGLLRTSELDARVVPFDLVVLSACSSAEGMLLVGQPLHGLVSTMLDGGSRGVVATRWQVGDASMVPFIEHFYKALAEGGSVVDALHATRLAAYRAGVSPATWGAVEYYGDPTLSLRLTPPTLSWWARATRPFRRALRFFSGAQ